MPSAPADVAIIGGGPAGAAAAATLAAHAPALRISLLDAGARRRPKPGEVLPAAAQALLRQLGAWPAFVAAEFVPGRAVASAWSGAEADERHGIFSAQGHGWQLDRARFDALLVDTAAAAGVAVRRDAAVTAATRTGDGWRLATAGGAVDARAVIWATGRRWRLARAFGATLTVHDQLAAHLRFYAGAPGDHRMTIEARPEGWWYTADLPGDRRVIACLTDPGSDLRDAAAWHHALAATRHIAPSLPATARETDALVASAGTMTIDPAAGDRWVAAGDTLFAADPLSSRGIVHALRSGILAGYATADMLAGHDDRARLRYAMIAARGFASYRSALAGHYAAAAWRTPFWQRRAGAGARRAVR